MKRLIKKSVLHDAINYNGDYFEIFKNPTYSEWDIINNYGQGIRGLIISNGDLYIWPVDLLHDKVKSFLNIEEEIYLIVESNTINSILSYVYDTQQLVNIILSCNSLYNYFNNNSIIQSFVSDTERLSNISINDLQTKLNVI
jgi:hypothetical protein